MKILEFEAKKLLSEHGIPIPRQFGLIPSSSDIPDFSYPIVAKIQVTQGRRGKRGGVGVMEDRTALEEFARRNFDSSYDGERPRHILAEEQIEKGEDIYVAFMYGQSGLALFINLAGGVEVEASREKSLVFPVSLLSRGFDLSRLPIPQEKREKLAELLRKLLGFFCERDCELLEINPLRFVGDQWVALDAKIILDKRRKADASAYASAGLQVERQKTEREKMIDQVNANSAYKGSPCRYVELDGDIALLLSGGGASLIIFDEVVERGLAPGNYSEYSGNPNQEKVYELTKIVLSKPGQRGLLIAGGIANFTMIDETMAGVARALAELKPRYPVVIRRGGPNEKRGREIILDLAKKADLDVTWIGSDKTLREAARIFAEKVGGKK